MIISPDEYNTNSDIVIAFVTSNLNVDCRMGDYKIEHWQEADLPKPSMIRMKVCYYRQVNSNKKTGADCRE